MSKKKKIDKNIQGKVISIFKTNFNHSFNYKQVASKLGVQDTRGRKYWQSYALKIF